MRSLWLYDIVALRHTRWLYIGPLEETGNLNHDEHVDIHENRFRKTMYLLRVV